MDIKNWKFFDINKIFILEKGKCNNSTELVDGNDTFYIGAKKSENGVMKRVQWNEELISKGNCISFICQGEGSNGFNNYFDIPTIQTNSNTLGYNEKLNVLSGLFFVTLLDLERPKFSFGRGRSNSLSKSKVLLPQTKNGEIDWNWIENFMLKLWNEEILKINNLLQKKRRK